jgi:Protein of unknown function (DUF2752)
VSRSRQLWLWLLAGLAGGIGIAVLHVWVPAEGTRNAVCLTRRFLGIPCPGCGLTRAFGHLAKGEWNAALLAHPLAPVFFVELIGAWVWAGVDLARGLPLRAPRWFEPVAVGHVAVLCALWVGRLSTGTLPW